VLGHVADPRPHPHAVGLAVEAQHARGAGRGRDQPEQDLDQGAFAGAVGADQADHAGLDAHREPVERGHALGIALGQLPRLDQRRSGAWWMGTPRALGRWRRRPVRYPRALRPGQRGEPIGRRHVLNPMRPSKAAASGTSPAPSRMPCAIDSNLAEHGHPRPAPAGAGRVEGTLPPTSGA
jgi:hypothetical protein